MSDTNIVNSVSVPQVWYRPGADDDGYRDARERRVPLPLLDEAGAALTELLSTQPHVYWQREPLEIHCRRPFRLSPVQANELMRMHGATTANGLVWGSADAIKAWPAFLDRLLGVLPSAEGDEGVTMEDIIAKLPGVHPESVNTALWWLCDKAGQVWCITQREPWQRRSRAQGPKEGGWHSWSVFVRAPAVQPA